MNCKQGDLAIIVKSRVGNEGKIVRCVKFIGNNGSYLQDDVWRIDQKILNTHGDYEPFTYDSWLRPIRDSDKQDEMLSIVNLKEKVKS